METDGGRDHNISGAFYQCGFPRGCFTLRHTLLNRHAISFVSQSDHWIDLRCAMGGDNRRDERGQHEE